MWLKPQGYGYCFDVNGAVHQHDTATCSHCNRVFRINSGCRPEDVGGYCRLCAKIICTNCVDKGICDPIEKKLERMEARDIALRSYGV